MSQVIVAHVGSTQCPDASQVVPLGHGNSPRLQLPTQFPWKQIGLSGSEQSPSPSSITPLQSLSTLSQVSGPGCTTGRQAAGAPPMAQSVWPTEHAPCKPVMHGWLPPMQLMPET